MIRKICLDLLQVRGDARMCIVAALFVSIFRFVVEFNVDAVTYDAVLFHALVDAFVFYTTAYFMFVATLSALIPGKPPGIPAVAALGLLLGIAPPVLEALIPSLGGKYYDYMFSWQVFFYDPAFQPLAETVVVWITILGTGALVGIVTGAFWRAVAAALLAWLAIAWLGVIVPSLLFPDGNPSLLSGRRSMSLVFVVTSIAIFHGLRVRAHWRCVRRMNHGLPFIALALCGSAFAAFDAWESAWRAALIGYLCLVLLLHNDYYDHLEDQLAARPASTDASDVAYSTWLTTLLLFSVARFAPMVAMCASGMLLLGFAYHHPAFRLKENFCLSYKIEGGWALCAFSTGVSGPLLFDAQVRLAWPSLLVFGGGALLSIPKDWKDVVSDRAARIPTLYVRLAKTEEEEARLHRKVVAAVGVGMALALALVSASYGISLWLPVLVAGALPALAVLVRMRSRSAAVEIFLTLLGVWLIGASLLLRDVLPSALPPPAGPDAAAEAPAEAH